MEKLLSLRLLLFVALALAFPASRAAINTGNLAFDAISKEYNPAVGEMTAEFDFSLTNIATTNITIRSVRASCGCTTPKLPALPWELAAGANGSFHVTADLRGKSGRFSKTVSLDTTDGMKLLYVNVNIPQSAAGNTVPGMDSRTRNAQIALADRQAIFTKSDCATCHKPSPDLMGERLFTAACGICHEADHRATAVPDLHALKAPPTDAYWEAWVRYGKVGTMMPAFASDNQGPLSDEQISSLVKFLVNDFPNRAPKGKTVHLIAPPPRSPQAIRIPSVDDLKLGAPPVPPTPGS